VARAAVAGKRLSLAVAAIIPNIIHIFRLTFSGQQATLREWLRLRAAVL
jgi:hypothetical protein